MNRRQILRSAAALPAAGVAFSAAAAQQKQIKITALETDVHKQPPGTPTYDAIHKLGVDSGSVALRLRTEREHAAAMENARVRTALDRVSVGTLLADTDGKIIYMNEALRALFRHRTVEIRKLVPAFDCD